ncbi:MAG: phycobiliprotein lyase [Geitlerinemataceae cyanobacterium]
MSIEIGKFQNFFDCCVGNWATERTYHYMTRAEVERSHTDFGVKSLTPELKAKVLTDNQYPLPEDIDILPGYHLAFNTVSDKGEKVSQELNFLFVPRTQDESTIEGDYLRDRAYEEAKPIVSQFQFHTESRELLMTTFYTRVISVDSITLVNPNLRIRKILNYERPSEGQPLENVVLVGFGVEQKVVAD